MITLEEIHFNSLRPWSHHHEDPFLYRELNARLHHMPGYGPGMYFTKLQHAFPELGLEPAPETVGEWKCFAGTDRLIPEGLFSKLGRYRHPSQKVGFYANLLSNCGFAELDLLDQDFDQHPDPNYQRHKLRNLCTRMERMISMPNPDKDLDEEDLTIIKLTKLTAIIIYLEIVAKYSRQLHSERLKLTPEGIFEELAMISLESKPSGPLVREVKRTYLPYFKTGPAAYEDDQLREKQAHIRQQKDTGLHEASPASVGTKEKQKVSKNDKAEDRIIGSGEVMSILGISKGTLKRWRDDEKVKIPFSRPNPKGRCYYKLSEIIEFAKTRKKNTVENNGATRGRDDFWME